MLIKLCGPGQFVNVVLKAAKLRAEAGIQFLSDY